MTHLTATDLDEIRQRLVAWKDHLEHYSASEFSNSGEHLSLLYGYIEQLLDHITALESTRLRAIGALDEALAALRDAQSDMLFM